MRELAGVKRRVQDKVCPDWRQKAVEEGFLISDSGEESSDAGANCNELADKDNQMSEYEAEYDDSDVIPATPEHSANYEHKSDVPVAVTSPKHRQDDEVDDMFEDLLPLAASFDAFPSTQNQGLTELTTEHVRSKKRKTLSLKESSCRGRDQRIKVLQELTCNDFVEDTCTENYSHLEEPSQSILQRRVILETHDNDTYEY
ncbi:uncharacterized protein LOC134180316 isoform X1 [Corticium candelabrum]|uniref:uncharacterized protein LOC134180316 isoform X1 n=1 Tax=Corticium candelabrum TaxID=121492 RepID=UPI002E25CAA1|nr:uncharacterized protein LOC134180316 isoform X1 [Corticium candelabrum]